MTIAQRCIKTPFSSRRKGDNTLNRRREAARSHAKSTQATRFPRRANPRETQVRSKQQKERHDAEEANATIALCRHTDRGHSPRAHVLPLRNAVDFVFRSHRHTRRDKRTVRARDARTRRRPFHGRMLPRLEALHGPCGLPHGRMRRNLRAEPCEPWPFQKLLH